MNPTAIIYFVFMVLVSAVAATETNADRMARGLNPLTPVNLRRSRSPTHVQIARNRPSSTPPICSVHGTRAILMCCQTLSGTNGSGCTVLADDECRANSCHHHNVCCGSRTGNKGGNCVPI